MQLYLIIVRYVGNRYTYSAQKNNRSRKLKSGQALSLIPKQKSDFDLLLFAGDSTEAKELAMDVVAHSSFLQALPPVSEQDDD